MADVLMFPVASPSGTSSGDQGKSVEPATSSDAFDISPGVWSQLGQLVGQANGAAGAIAGFPQPNSHHPHLVTLRSSWDAFAGAIKSWSGGTEPALKALAADIVSYGTSVAPPGYNALISMLQAMGLKPLTQDQAQQCASALTSMQQAATARADAAAKATSQIAPLAQALTSLQSALGQVPARNPPVKVVLPDVPGICLAYGGDGLACAAQITDNNPRALWQVFPYGVGMEFYFVANDGRVLVIEPDGNDSPTRYQRFSETARPSLAAASAALAGGEATAVASFKVPPPGQKGLIQSQRYPRYAMDCAGNGGWTTGTPILNYLVNNGVNQHWQIEPPTWDIVELKFYDLVAPIARSSASLAAIQRVEGDWRAIASDLQAAIGKALASVNTKIPFITALQVKQVLTAWGNLATDAQAAAAGLG